MCVCVCNNNKKELLKTTNNNNNIQVSRKAESGNDNLKENKKIKKVPRKAESGNDDLYPETFAGKAALNAQEWLSVGCVLLMCS